MTPRGPMSAEQVHALFQSAGFEPPADMPLQDAFDLLMQVVQRQMQQQSLRSTPPRGRTAIRPSLVKVPEVLEKFGVSAEILECVGVEVKGVDTTQRLHPELAGAIEMLMAEHGFVLFRDQGSEQNEMNIRGRYLTGDQQCELSLAFGKGELHSTHGNHEECPNRDIFRLSNDASHGFNEVGPEWHNDGSFCRSVFGYVVYHIVKAPEGPGNTHFAHLGKAYDLLRSDQKDRFSKCASVNSNGGVVHPLVHDHPVSGRTSLFVHTGMTGSIIERAEAPKLGLELSGIKAWNHKEMDSFFVEFTDLLDRPEVSVSHKWREGDVIIIDNLAVAHKASLGAHQMASGLRILHRTTCAATDPLDPSPQLQFPLLLDTARPCPFKEDDAVWVEGYVGFRWGDWQKRSRPH